MLIKAFQYDTGAYHSRIIKSVALVDVGAAAGFYASTERT